MEGWQKRSDEGWVLGMEKVEISGMIGNGKNIAKKHQQGRENEERKGEKGKEERKKIAFLHS